MTRSPVASRNLGKVPVPCFWVPPCDAGFSTFSKVSDYGQCVKKCLWFCSGFANGTSGSEGFWELLRKETRIWKSVIFPFQKTNPLNMKNIKHIQYTRVFSHSCYSCKVFSIFWDPTYGSNLVTEERHRGGLRWAGADGWWPCTTQGHGALPGWVRVALRFRGGFWRGEKICALDMIFCWILGGFEDIWGVCFFWNAGCSFGCMDVLKVCEGCWNLEFSIGGCC